MDECYKYLGICSYCKTKGHVKSECWYVNRDSRSPEIKRNSRPSCPYCNGPHLGMNSQTKNTNNRVGSRNSSVDERNRYSNSAVGVGEDRYSVTRNQRERDMGSDLNHRADDRFAKGSERANVQGNSWNNNPLPQGELKFKNRTFERSNLQEGNLQDSIRGQAESQIHKKMLSLWRVP